MAVSPELIKKIADYEGQGYTPDEIVAGLAQSSTFKDIAAKVGFYQRKGYGPSEILDGIRESAPRPEEHPLSGDTPEMRLKAMNPDYKLLTPEGESPTWAGIKGAAKETFMTLERPVLQGAGTGLGAVAGTPAGPLGQVAGAGLGYAAGTKASDILEEVMGLKEPAPLKDQLEKTGITALFKRDPIEGLAAFSESDIGTGMKYEMLGASTAVGLSKALQAVGWTWKKLPAMSNKGAEKKAGEMLVKSTSKGPIYAKNAEEAAAIEQKIQGLKFTRGQATSDPAAIMQERALSSQGVTSAKDVEQRAAGSEATRNYYAKNFSAKENIDDVIGALKNRESDIGHNLTASKKALGSEAKTLGKGMDAQESGKRIFDKLKSAKEVAREEKNRLYENLPNTPLTSSDDIIKEARRIRQSLGAFENTDKNIPAVFDDIEEVLRGKGSANIGFKDLQSLKARLNNDIQMERSGASPNDYKVKRLAELKDFVVKQMKKLGDSKKYGDVSEQFNATEKFYAEKYAPFKQGVVGEVLRPGMRGEQSRVASADIAGKFFKSGKLDAADELIKAIGNDKQARQAIRDYAAHDLLKSAENPATGELTSGKVFGWYAKNRPMLEKFGLTNEFNNLVKAQRSVDAFGEISESFNKSVAGKILRADADKALLQAFAGNGGKNTGETARQLISLMKGDKAGEGGLKKAFADHLMKQMENAGHDVMNNPVISVAKGQKILKQYAPAMRELYKKEPEKIKALYTIQRVYEMLGRNQKSPIGGGSDTTEKIIEAIAQDVTKRTEAIPGIGRALKILNTYDRQQTRKILAKAVFDPDYAETLIIMAKGAPNNLIEKRLAGHGVAVGLSVTKNKD